MNKIKIAIVEIRTNILSLITPGDGSSYMIKNNSLNFFLYREENKRKFIWYLWNI